MIFGCRFFRISISGKVLTVGSLRTTLGFHHFGGLSNERLLRWNRRLRMGLRDGVSMNFWQDRWTDSGEWLIDSVLGDHSAIDTDQPVSAFVSNTGEWNWSLFSHLLTLGGRLQVAGMSSPVSDAGEDQITWGLERDGRFRIRSAYSLVAEDVEEPTEGLWKIIWRWKGPQRSSVSLASGSPSAPY
ncbi:hypothetical protein LINPERHAP2_LOCUS9519 [Linum perenne]